MNVNLIIAAFEHKHPFVALVSCTVLLALLLLLQLALFLLLHVMKLTSSSEREGKRERKRHKNTKNELQEEANVGGTSSTHLRVELAVSLWFGR
jgi:hypothetical protein